MDGLAFTCVCTITGEGGIYLLPAIVRTERCRNCAVKTTMGYTSRGGEYCNAPACFLSMPESSYPHLLPKALDARVTVHSLQILRV